MKKTNVFVLVLLLFVLASCSKSDDNTPEPVTPADTTNNNNNGSGISEVPSSFTQKVLLETFVGAWCSTCPDADYKRDQVVNSNPGRIIAATAHQSDGMAIPLYNTLYSTFTTNIPSGMVNRTPSLGVVVFNQTQWMSNTTVALGKTAKCGVAITSSVVSGSATIDIHAGFKETLTGNYTLTVYLVEDKVTGTGTGYNQSNAYSGTSGSPFYNLGNPIVNYQHNRVVRKVLTANLGDPIPASKMVTGGEFTKTFTTTVNGYNQNELYVVAFVNKTGTSATTYEIMNVQQSKIGVLKDWD